MTKKFLYRSVHQLDANGHGGNRRLAQIIEILESRIPGLEVGCDRFSRGSKGDIQSILAGIPWALKPIGNRFSHPRALRNAGVVRRLCKELRIDSDTTVIFDSYLRGYAPAFRYISDRGGKVVLFPQNLDSVTAGTVDPMTGRVGPSWLRDEIRTLGEANLVCCISREEQWLLSLYGIPALYLPYYPTRDTLASLNEIRRRRSELRQNTNVLIMGSVGNVPTLRGMRELIDNAADLTEAARGREVILAGFGTEMLQSASLPAKFRVVGGISQSELDKHLIETAVCLCYQPGTGGALTRIPELLCAGVPVIANYVAARSYHSLPGLHVAESISHLLQILKDFKPEDFSAPERPSDLEAVLHQGLQGL